MGTDGPQQKFVAAESRRSTFDMSVGPKGAKRPLERPLDEGVRSHFVAVLAASSIGLTPNGRTQRTTSLGFTFSGRPRNSSAVCPFRRLQSAREVLITWRLTPGRGVEVVGNRSLSNGVEHLESAQIFSPGHWLSDMHSAPCATDCFGRNKSRAADTSHVLNASPRSPGRRNQLPLPRGT